MTSDDCTEKMQRYQEYVEALEEERRKIQVFERELPLCLELVSQAIETYKQQLYFHGQSECSEESEQTSSEGPVLEEFMPIKRTSSSDDELQSHKSKNNDKDNKNHDKCSKKSDWLRSVQLWNQTPDSEASPRKVSVTEVKRNGGGAFHPFKREKREKSVGITPTAAGRSPSSVPATVASLTAETGGCSKKDKKEGEESQRKARRCWSQELHRRFLQALQQLGGSHVATPKQIRELMKVDGLTNDEVKSHLQKYRLHTRRPTTSIHTNNNPQAPQFLVVGGIWVPPREYSAVAKTAAPGEAAGVANPNGIYAPIAAPPPPPLLRPTAESQAQRKQNKQSKKSPSGGRPGHSKGGVHFNSPASSSSTHTSSASPAL